MKAKHVLALIGGMLMLAGALIAVIPVTSRGQSCGSVLSGANPYIAPTSCEDLRSMLAIPVWILLIIGAIVALSSLALVDRDAAAKRKQWDQQHGIAAP